MSKVWLITGASRGLGRSTLEAEEQARHETMQRWKPVTLAADFDAVSPEWPSE